MPPEAGALARSLSDLQADGCPLAPPFDALYRRDPLLLVAVHYQGATALDLSEVCGTHSVTVVFRQPCPLQLKALRCWPVGG